MKLLLFLILLSSIFSLLMVTYVFFKSLIEYRTFKKLKELEEINIEYLKNFGIERNS